MKRKITDLEQKLIENGWYLTIKRYIGKHSEKTHCYEYHKTSDIRNNGKTYDQIIMLNQKRSQIVDFGINNMHIDFLNEQELCLIRFLHMELRHFVERISKSREPKEIKPLLNRPSDSDWEYCESREIEPMTPEQFDELCQEMEKQDAEIH